MNSETSTKGNPSGLKPDVRQRLIAALIKMLPEWLIEPNSDLKRVHRPMVNFSYFIDFEPFKGMGSWVSFRKKYEAEVQNALDKLIREQQPELLGWVNHDGNSEHIKDCFTLCSFLMKEATKRISETTSTDEAVLSVVSDLESLIITGSAKREVLTLLTGLQLPKGVDKITLGNDLYIRRLMVNEIAEFGSNDILSKKRDLSSYFVTAAAISETSISIWLSPQCEEGSLPDLSNHQVHQNRINNILGALQILKSNCVGLLASFTTIHPTILPNMSGHSSVPHFVNPFSFMEMTEEDVDPFVTAYKVLAENQRDELDIAVRRLLDAENRLSPADALLDAYIGLEVLLKKKVPESYAELAPESEYHTRFKDADNVRLIRNRVVHQGLNMKSKDAALLHDSAELAKNCLRDVIKRNTITKPS